MTTPDLVRTVEQRLLAVASAEGATAAEQAGLSRLWKDVASAVDVGRTQKPETWAAAVYYAYLRIRFDGTTQAEAAQLFGISVQSVTAKFKQVDEALHLEAYDARYVSESDRPQILREMDERLRPFREAHAHSDHHRTEVEASEVCGCFYCLATFAPSRIEAWIDEGDGGETAICPVCGIDAVLGSASGLPITGDFLRAMRAHWFS